MRQVYIKQIRLLEPVAPVHYIYDDVIRPGLILEVLNLSAYWTAIATTEEIHFFVEEGTRKVFLGEDAVIDTSGHAFWQGRVFIGEGAQLGAYCPDSAAADILWFDIFGVLHFITKWGEQP